MLVCVCVFFLNMFVYERQATLWTNHMCLRLIDLYFWKIQILKLQHHTKKKVLLHVFGDSDEPEIPV